MTKSKCGVCGNEIKLYEKGVSLSCNYRDDLHFCKEHTEDLLHFIRGLQGSVSDG